MQTKLAQGAGTPKSTYQSIYNVIGDERMKLMRAYIIEVSSVSRGLSVPLLPASLGLETWKQTNYLQTKGRGEASKEQNTSNNDLSAVSSRPPSAPQQATLSVVWCCKLQGKQGRQIMVE